MSFRPFPLLLALPLGLLPLACNRSPEPGGQQASSGSSSPATSGPKAKVVTLDAARFASLQAEKGGLILDVRTPPEVARGRLKGASVVDYTDRRFASRVGKMQKDKPVFVYCASGARSAAAARMMTQLGFAEVYDLAGGIMSWKRARLPVEAGRAPRAEGAAVLSPAKFDELLAKHTVVLADFHTPWCNPCIEMAPVVDWLSADYNDRARVVRIDVDESEALATREKVVGVPVFVIYQSGQETWRHSGKLSKAELAAQLDKALSPAEPPAESPAE